jgi:hypothetical protein
MKQKQYKPLTVAEMALSLYAVNEGYLDDVTIGNVVAFEAELHEHARGSHKAAMDALNAKPEHNDETVASLKKIVESYRQTSTLITVSEEKEKAKPAAEAAKPAAEAAKPAAATAAKPADAKAPAKK